MGTPLELVKYNQDNGKFEVGQEAIATLRKVKAPLGVVAVSGRARQGKSYVLNCLLQQSSGGFKVGPTHRPCTKGLWMWSQPQRRVSPDGSEHYLVLLDTEGIDAWDQTAQYSTQIFSLAVLLSSLFVYNQMGGIDESALDRLSLVTEMTKHIRVKAGGADQQRLGDFTPAFLWLLRDFYLRLEEDGRKVTAKDYLETALMPVTGSGASVEAKNAIRSSIKSLFPDRDCFTLVRPMNDESQLVNLDEVPRSQLRPEFAQGVKSLIDIIFKKAEPKRYGSQYVTGPVLAGLVEAYVAAINEGAVPTIATAWQGVAESESRRAADAAEKTYAESFNAEVLAEETALDQEHQRCLELARKAFEDVAVGDENIKRAHEKKFLQAVTSRYGEVRARRLAEAASRVNEMLYQATMSISQAARSGRSLSEVQAQLQSFMEEFQHSAAGPTKWQRLAEFLRDTYPGVASEMINRAEKTAREAQSSLQRELDEARRSMGAAESRAAEVGRRLQEVEAELGQLRQLRSEQQQEAAELRVQLEKAEARSRALETQLKETIAVNEMHLHSAGEQAEARLRSLSSEYEVKIAELQTQLSMERSSRAQHEGDVSALRSRMTAMEQQINTLSSEAADWRQRYSSAMEERVGLMRERDEARDQASRFNSQKEGVSRENIMLQEQLSRAQRDLQNQNKLRDDLQARLDTLIAEAQAARTEAQEGARPRPAPASAHTVQDVSASYDNDENDAGAVGNGAAASHLDVLNKMTVLEIKDWLTQQGHADAVWAYQSRKPVPKKQDWVALAREKATAA
mmetsp:Transcript_35733/g.79501  ORF Transcript_35733/g.79501 Transcript_35733/m.79501 type:complete len:796 (+) Transcript_35733:196-2583(+)